MATRESLAMQKLERAMVGVFHDGDVEDAKETLRECLRATRTIRSGRDAGGHLIYEEVPDYPIRLSAGVKIIEWAVGKPTQRSIVAQIDGDRPASGNVGTDDLMKLLLDDPRTAADIVLKLKDAAAKVAAEGSTEINVTPVVPPQKSGASES